MKQLTVEAIKWQSVAGKETYYIKIKGEHGETLINVGQKTYESVNKLNEGKSPIEEPGPNAIHGTYKIPSEEEVLNDEIENNRLGRRGKK